MKPSKRLMSLLLAGCLAMSVLPALAVDTEVDAAGDAGAVAAEADADSDAGAAVGEEVTLQDGQELKTAATSGTCGDDLTWAYDTASATLTISGTGAMTNWSKYSYVPWSTYRNNIKTVVIGSGATTIGKCAFYCCKALKSVTISDSVTTVNYAAFCGCDALKSVTIPDSVTVIGESAFENCQALSDVTIGNGVTVIYKKAFCKCSALRNITIPNSVVNILEYAFAHCGGLTSVTIPDSVTSLGEGAFYDCNALKHATLGRGVIAIEKSAFEYCTGLESITIPDSVTSFGSDAFHYCSSLENIYYTGTKEQWKVISRGLRVWSETPSNIMVHYNSTGPAATTDTTTQTDTATSTDTTSSAETTTPFSDVASSDWFADSVTWAVNKGITLGTSATTFSPNDSCTRAQIVTFLWRSAGSPAPTTNNNPFSDVSSSDWYASAVLWAVENGITSGTSATTFSPNDTCLRSQAMTFIWRANNQPGSDGNNPFTDLPSGEWYTDAVLWAVSNGITVGTSTTTFGPNDTCTRSQIVTFLYRAA